MVPRHEDRGGFDSECGLDQEPVPTEAGVALATVRIEDSEAHPPARRASSITGDERLRPLADDVASEMDPRPPRQLEPQSRRLCDRSRKAGDEIRWLEDDDAHTGSPPERREAPQPIP